eukprot:2187218-Ditylum_brightwellii.AAC.2
MIQPGVNCALLIRPAPLSVKLSRGMGTLRLMLWSGDLPGRKDQAFSPYWRYPQCGIGMPVRCRVQGDYGSDINLINISSDLALDCGK